MEEKTMPMTEFVKTEQQCLESAKRGVAWLLKQQGTDGGWKVLDNAPIDAYYKAGWAFGLMGEAAAAERALDYVKQHLLQSDGDFLPRGDAWYIDIHYQYANGWITTGAQKQGRYDVSMPAVRFLLTQQDPDHGGFYAQRAAAGQKRRSDTMSSGIAGIACLATGQMDAARKLAGCFEHMIEMQPAPAERFYMTIEANGQLGTKFPEDEAGWRVIEVGQKDQVWYAVGLPFVFSVLLHQATGEERYAKLAQWFFDFQSRCVNPWDGSSSGKAAWGCSILYHMTGEQRYRDIALHVARIFMGCQTPDGWFQWGGQPAYGGGATGGQKREFTPDDFDITAEYVVWLGLIGSNLLARDKK